MATVVQPDGYVKTVNEDGIEVITDFKFTSVSFVANSPIYKSFLGSECPHCGSDFFRFVGSDAICVGCNEKMVHVVDLKLENDDIIESRFEILDL